MFDLTAFSLADMVACSSAIRRAGTGCTSMEQAARAVVDYLRDAFLDKDTGRPSPVLVRLFKTHRADRLDPSLRSELDPEVVDRGVRCLTLLATNGDEEPWRDRTRSSRHKVIPLATEDAIGAAPMVAALIEQLGVAPAAVIDPAPHIVEHLDQRSFDVFHIEEASGSPQVPDQDFVVDHGVRSVLGFGGMLPSGDVFAVVLFSRTHIPRQTAELFRSVAVSTKVALLPFVGGRVFESDTTEPARSPAADQSLILALEQLLEVDEGTAVNQARRLSSALADLEHNEQRLLEEAQLVETLHWIGSALTAELDLERVVDAVTEAATIVTGAQFGAFFYNVVDRNGEAYMLYTLSGVPRSKFEGFPMPRNTAVFDSTFRGEGAVRSDDITKDPRYGKNEPYFGMPKGHLPVRSYLAVPVVSRSGEVLGGLFFGHEEVGVFNDRDERLLVGIAAQAAIAIDNARLYQRAEESREEAESVATRLRRLQAFTAQLSATTTQAEVYEALSGASGALDSDSEVVCVVSPDGVELEVVHERGLSATSKANWSRFPLESPTPASDAVRHREIILFGSLADRDRMYPVFRGAASVHKSFATIPLVIEERVFGALTLAWDRERAFTDDDRQFFQAVANQFVQALERARLAELDRQTARRQQLLADASRLLNVSLDFEETVSRTAHVLVPDLADSATIYLVGDDGEIVLAGLANADPSKVALMRQLFDLEGRAALAEIVTTGVSQFFPDVDPAALAGDTERDELRRQLSVHSGMAVPLRAGGRTFGVLTATRDAPGRPFTTAELILVQDLADRAAAAINNARAHRERTEVARTLQASLLPPTLEAVPGLEVAWRYHPVGEGIEVGGDFYDLFPLGDDRWGVVIGDVCGKGVPAASLTALARYTVRTAAMRETTPSEVLAVLNRAIAGHDVGERFCTIAHAFVEPLSAGTAKVVLAIGGHPLPVLVRPDGTTRTVGKPGIAIGLFEDAPDVTDVEVVLSPGDALVFFTDGVTEARAPDGRFEPELLETTLAACAEMTAEEMATSVEQAVLEFQGGHPRDDMALVVLRVPRDVDQVLHRRLMSVPESVPVARRLVRAWLRAVGADDPESEHALTTSVTELVSNAVRYSRAGVRLRAWKDVDVLNVEVIDDGEGFTVGRPTGDEVPDPLGERGRGLYIVRALCDECDLESTPSGTTVRIRKRLRT